MYPVDEAAAAAIRGGVRRCGCKIEIAYADGGTEAVFESSILQGSAYLSSQCSDDAGIRIGGVYASEFGAALFACDVHGPLAGAVLRPFFRIQTEDDIVEIPMGVFRVSSVEYGRKTVSVTAFDAMLAFCEKLHTVPAGGQAYALLSYACDACGVVLATTREEIARMPNGGESFSVYGLTTENTYRDVLHAVAEALGGFCVIDRSGALRIKTYDTMGPVRVIGAAERYSSAYAPSVTVTGIASVNAATGRTELAGTEDGANLICGANPLLYAEDPAVRKRYLSALCGRFSGMSFVPFSAVTIGDPCMDMGDAVTFSCADAYPAGAVSFVTSSVFRFGGKQDIRGAGLDSVLTVGEQEEVHGMAAKMTQALRGIYASAETAAALEAAVNALGASVSLTAEYGSNSIGSHVRALLELVANADSSNINLRADKINFSGVTEFVRPYDIGAHGSTVIDGGRIDTTNLTIKRLEDGATSAELDANGLKLYRASTSSPKLSLYANESGTLIRVELGAGTGIDNDPDAGKLILEKTEYSARIFFKKWGTVCYGITFDSTGMHFDGGDPDVNFVPVFG